MFKLSETLKFKDFIKIFSTLYFLNLSCTIETKDLAPLEDKIHIAFLHTTDIHSRLLPYHMVVSEIDKNLGLEQKNAPFGGASKLSFLVKKERKKSQRVLYLDSGDCFQGAPIFNYFYGEAEMRVLSLSGLDAMAVGNHDFDLGVDNLVNQISKWADFPLLASNYIFEDPDTMEMTPLGQLVFPYEIFNLKGIKVGVVGMGNLSSMTSIYETGNRLGITPLDPCETAQFYINLLKPQVNLIVFLSHLGLDEDEKLVGCTSGIDIILGGHHHVVLYPPKVLRDCQDKEIKEKMHCKERNVILAHSGAFLKYLGRLDVIIEKNPSSPAQWEVVSHKYKIFPVDTTIPDDPLVAEIIEPYRDKLNQIINLDLIIGYAPDDVRRFGKLNGDSALGNIVATSMWKRRGVETDFSFTNSTGIRTDLYSGPATIDEMFNIFPFENTITQMYLSGNEVIELFDYAARRTADRGCKSQAQVAGVRVKLQCGGCDLTKRPTGWPLPIDAKKGCALSIKFGNKKVLKEGKEVWEGEDINPNGVYELSTNNYIAWGGSGYMVLKKNTTKQDTGISQRDALIDYIRSGKPCLPLEPEKECPKGFLTCENFLKNENLSSYLQCNKIENKCVLENCIKDVSQRLIITNCSNIKNKDEKVKCEKIKKSYAFQQCGEISCIDKGIGAIEDGRIEVIVK